MIDIKFHKIWIRNFLSYGNIPTEINLLLTDPTLIIGKNYDSMVGGQIDSNGAGKTTILNALCYCIYDEVISDITKNKLINFINKKDMEVTLIFEINSIFYKITRFRKHSVLGGDGVKIYRRKDDMDFTEADEQAPDSIKNSNLAIAKIVGMPFDIFSRIVVFSAKHAPFLSLPASHASEPNQRDMMEELFGITELSERAEVIKEDIKKNKSLLDEFIKEHERIQIEKTTHETRLSTAKQRVDQWEIDQKTKIINAESKIKNHSSYDFDLNSKLFEKLNKIETSLAGLPSEKNSIETLISSLQNKITAKDNWDSIHSQKIQKIDLDISNIDPSFFEVDRISLEKIAKLKPKLTEYIGFIANNIKDRDKFKQNITALENENAHLKDNSCPYCKQSMKNAALKLDSNDLQIVEISATIQTLQDEIDFLEIAKTNAENEINKLMTSLKYKTIESLTKDETNLNNLIQTLSNLKTEINPYADTNVDKLQAELSENKNKLETIINLINSYNEDKNLIKAELNFASERELLNIQNELINNQKLLLSLNGEINPHIEALKDIKDIKIIDNVSSKIDAIEDDLEHQNFLVKLLTRKIRILEKHYYKKIYRS